MHKEESKMSEAYYSPEKLFRLLLPGFKKDKPVVYLCGPMESVPDWGAGWRDKAARSISELGMYAINPCELEGGLAELRGAGVGTIQDMRARGDWPAVEKHMGPNIDVDLYAVSQSDALLLNWQGEAMCGSIGEITLARYLGIPVYTVSAVPPEVTASWLAGCCSDHKFTSMEAALTRIHADLEETVR